MQYAGPLTIVFMALLAPIMGLIVTWSYAGMIMLFIISTVFAGLCIYRIKK